MKIALSGATGFLGTALKQHLLDLGLEVIPLTRLDIYAKSKDLSKVLHGCDVVIHLAGANIFRRWTRYAKQAIYSSRICTTQNIVNAMSILDSEHRPKQLICASAIGIYETDSSIHEENSQYLRTDYLGELIQEWEKQANSAKDSEVNVAILRTGIVLHHSGGALKKLLPLFKLGLGGKLSSGNQPFPFIALTDYLRAVVHILNNKLTGVYNLVSPEIITNKEFTKELATKLHRPAIFAVPAFALRLALGEVSKELTETPFIKPAALLSSGFQFSMPSISSTLTNGIK
ncbi:TIGR01777 family protein [Puteibacter caeruleilacunae]|nr:TIGR01777 family protein [Puteibacter caeruleilacunae]